MGESEQDELLALVTRLHAAHGTIEDGSRYRELEAMYFRAERLAAERAGERAELALQVATARKAEQKALWAYQRALERMAALHEIVEAVARGFSLTYAEHRDAMVCTLCDAGLEVDHDDDGPDSERNVIGWYEDHIRHVPDCPVTKARALLDKERN